MDPITLLTWGFPVVVLIILVIVAFLFATTESVPKVNVADSEKTFLDTSTGKRTTFPSLTDAYELDLSVVVPAYNEESRLGLMLEDCLSYLTQSSLTYEIVIVDDGSKDKTTSVALEWSRKLGSDKLRVLTLEKNVGKGGAVRRGMLVTRGKLLLFADADGATKFSELAKLLKALDSIDNDFAIVCGSRAHLESDSIAQRSAFRTLLMYGFHLCVRVFGCKSVKDTQCGFKLLTRPAAEVVFKSLHIERWAFDVELLKIAEMLHISLAEVAVQWTEIEGSKLNPMLDSIKMFKDLFLLWLRYAVGAWRIASKEQ